MSTDVTSAAATSDKLFLLSYSEIVPTSYWTSSYSWTSSEGTQYEAFRGKVLNNNSANDCLKIGGYWWERSVYPSYKASFLSVHSNGNPSSHDIVTDTHSVLPAFCF